MISTTTRNSAIAVTALTMLVIGGSAYPFPQVLQGRYELCETPECLSAAAESVMGMDKNADPCNDFFQFACGGWVKRNPIPEGRGTHTQFVLAGDRNEKILRDILSSDHSSDRDAIRMAKIYYKSCMNEDAMDEADALPIFDLMEDLGGFPLFNIKDETHGDFSIEKYLGKSKVRYVDFWSDISSPIINLGVNPDEKNSNQNIIRLDQPQLVLPNRNYYLSFDFEAAQMSYKKFLHDFLALVWQRLDEENGTYDFDEEILEKAIDEVFELEKSLAEILTPNSERVKVLDFYEKMTLAEMSDNISNDFDWVSYVQEVADKVGIFVGPQTEAVVLGGPYFAKMADVLSKFDSEVIQNYVVIYNLVDNMDLLSKKYRDTEAPFRKEIKGTAEEQPRWKVCISKAKSILPMPVGAVYVQNVFSEDSKDEILAMIDNILESFKSKLDKVEWMDDKTKAGAKTKVDNIATLIGYPDYINDEDDPRLDEEYEDVDLDEEDFFEGQFSLFSNQLEWSLKKLEQPVDREEWIMGPAEVNAYYNPQQNSMVFPAGILQPPFFDPNRPVAMNFGGIGTAIAWQLASVITYSGDFDENGDLTDWWSKESRQNYDTLLECFKSLYNAFFYEAAGMFLNGNTTVLRNVADNGGLRQAFYGYQKWAKENSEDEFALPGLESFTPDQLVLIANAQLWCEAERPEAAKKTITKGYDTPGIFRINGPARNFEEFGKAFKCKQGEDFLYPETDDTCVIV